MRRDKEIRNVLDRLKKQRITKGPYIKQKNIAWHTAKQALEWILEEKELLIF